MKRIGIWFVLAALLMTSLTGCKKEEPIVEESYEMVQEESSKEEVVESSIVEESSEEESSKEEEAVEEVVYINPLSGEPTETDITGNRPFVFMINNSQAAMPMCGVSKADMIMEMMDEGGVTRFMVWFMDPTDVPKIGSIRSARIYNVETAVGYNAILCHCGGSTEALNAIYNWEVEDLDAIYGDWGRVYYRDENRQTHGIEHSMFARGENVISAVTDLKGYDLSHPEGYDGTYGMLFSEAAAEQCNERAEHIQIVYAGGRSTSFEYDPATKAYTMYEFGSEYTDDGVGGIPFANVINMYARTWLQDDGCHLAIDLSEGEGTFFTEGKAVAIKWYKDGLEDCFHFTLEDGTPLQFSVGKTFMCVNQCGSELYTGSCEWE